MNIPNNVIIERAGSRYRARFRGYPASCFGDSKEEAFKNLRTMGNSARQSRNGEFPHTTPVLARVGRDEFTKREELTDWSEQ